MERIVLARSPFLLLSLFTFSVTFFPAVVGSDATMGSRGSLKDGETLVSAQGRFALGFFSPGRSAKRYLGIRFNEGPEKPVVWVANRDRPLDNATGILKFRDDGNLAILDRAGGEVVWSTKLAASTTEAGDRLITLRDTGNLVLAAAGGDGSLWESFDEPGDTLLPGMKLLFNTKTGASRHISSWTSDDDPSPGRYTYGLEIYRTLPRLVQRDVSSSSSSTTIMFSTGFWNGERFTGFPSLNANTVFNTSVVASGDEVYYTDRMINETRSLLRLILHPVGNFERIVWSEETGSWNRLWLVPAPCERYALCGPFSVCSENVPFPFCRCLRGFRPRYPESWYAGKGMDGCVREAQADCGDDFLKVAQVKLPELDHSSTVDMEMSLERCRDKCAKDCACTAYARADVREGGRGCITWSGGLLDIRNFSTIRQEFYFRVAASELDPPGDGDSKKSRKIAIVAAPAGAVAGVALLVLCGVAINARKRAKAIGTAGGRSDDGRRRRKVEGRVDGNDKEQLPLFDFDVIAAATDDFSPANKIGEGGFGAVYKGILGDGQEIAVKRLSWNSTQGVREFMNEVKLIAKLQHKNLVRLLGCCINDDDRMLIYEFLPNKSLDFFIFDESKRSTLGWRTRLNIVLGIARGLLYLHQDSRFKIIHRDLKAGNILLDAAMNPKISDFGTARIFGADQLTENTKMVIGTYGYMAPEYALNGIISVKSDVFSFGILVLEVLSGMKSRGVYGTDDHTNLLSLAWKLWQEGNASLLLDPRASVACSWPEYEVLRSVQIGLLCVQEQASDRPTMSTVVMMLGSENIPLPQPKRPGFLVCRSVDSTEVCSYGKHTANGLTVTSVAGR